MDKVLGDKERLKRMQQRALDLGDPHAAHKVGGAPAGCAVYTTVPQQV